MPFKKGGFMLALGIGAPILTVSLRGTRDALPAHGRRTQRGADILVTIHSPVDPSTYATLEPREARDPLANDVRMAVARGLS